MDKMYTLGGAGREIGMTRQAVHKRVHAGTMAAVRAETEDGYERVVGITAEEVERVKAERARAAA